MMRCFQGDRKMKHGKKCKIDKYTLILIVLLLLLTGLVIAWKLPQKEDRYIHVGIAVYDRSDTFMESYIRELEDKIGQTRILGKKVSYEIYDAEGIGSRQEKQLQEMYAQDYDVMLVNLVEPASAASVLTDAKDADIPVILFNREIDEKDLKISKNVWYVGTDARAAGVMQGELLKDLWKKQSRILDWNGNGMLDYVLVEGEESHFDAIRRTSGFLETGAELPLNQKGNILAEWKRELAYEKFAALDDEAVQNVEAVICNNDDMALGVISALNAVGYNTDAEAENWIPVIGVDATDAAKKLIADGKMVGTIKQDAEGMAACIAQLTQNTADGKELVDGVEKDMISEKVANKIFIPYGIYTGEK